MKVYVLLLVASLSACGGGSEQPAEPPRIQLFGDSTMHAAAPYWVERWGSRIEDRAKGGSSSTQLIAGTDKVNPEWPKAVDAPYYVVNHGLNDGWATGRINIAQYKANLRILAKAPGATAIFMTPNPSTLVGRDMVPYARAMREVAAEFNLRLIDTYACFQRQPNWRQRLPDGTHPDEQGLRFVVKECAAPVIDSLP